jgi:hypothetical protein
MHPLISDTRTVLDRIIIAVSSANLLVALIVSVLVAFARSNHVATGVW